MTRKQFINLFTDFFQKALMLHNKRQKYGIQSLEEEVEDLDDENFKTGLRMVIDEVEPGIIDEIFTNKISFEKCKYRRIYMAIVKRALLGIQEGLRYSSFISVLLSMVKLTKKEQSKIDVILLED